MALHLLHGTLHCTIFGAEDLVNEFRITGAAPGFLRQVISVDPRHVNSVDLCAFLYIACAKSYVACRGWVYSAPKP